MSKRKNERIKYIGLVDGASGKLGGKNSNDSGRVRFGKNEIYHWDPNKEYKEVAERRAENNAFREAVNACTAILSDETKKAAYAAIWAKHPEGYLTLRGYLIAKIRKGEIKG